MSEQCIQHDWQVVNGIWLGHKLEPIGAWVKCSKGDSELYWIGAFPAPSGRTSNPEPAAPAGGEWEERGAPAWRQSWEVKGDHSVGPEGVFGAFFTAKDRGEALAAVRIHNEYRAALTADLAAARAEAERLRAKAALADEEARRRRSKCGGCKMGLERFPHRDTYIHFPSQVQYRELGFTFEYKEGVTATECEADKTPWLYRYDALQPTHEQGGEGR